MPTPPHIVEAAKRAMDEGFTFYSSGAGLPELRQAVARKIETEHGVKVDPGREALICAGGIQGLYALFQVILGPGDEVLCFDPAYVGYEVHAHMAGAEIRFVPLAEDRGRYQVDFDALEDFITPRTKALILNSPQNPTGMVMSLSDLERLALVARKHDLVVISDEAYEAIIYGGLKHHSILSLDGMKERTVLLASVSKTYRMSGWRIGYVVAPAAITSAMLKLQSYMVLCVNTIAQKAAAAALNGPQDFIPEMVEILRGRRDTLIDSLHGIPGLSCSFPDGAFFLFCRVDVPPYDKDSFKLAVDLLKEAKVGVYPGIAYGDRGEGHIRFAFGGVKEPVLREAGWRIRKFFEALPG